MFRGGVLLKVTSFQKPPQIVSQSSIRGRMQEQTRDFPKFLSLFFFFKIKFKEHFMFSFTELTMARRRYFNPFNTFILTFHAMTTQVTGSVKAGFGPLTRRVSAGWLLSASLPLLCPGSCIYGKGYGHYQKKHGLAASELLLQAQEC